MATSGDLITAAFNKVGVYNPTSNQTASALTSLNNMISFWGIERLFPSVTREDFTLTSGDAEYTIGSGGDFNTVRPIKIENAYLRDSNSYDYPLDIVAAKDINSITYKATESIPGAMYYIPEETLGKIIFECEPNEAFTLYIESWKPYTEFTDTTTTVTLPPEYKEAIIYNLAISLAEDWDRVVSKSVNERAKETKYLLSAAGAASRPVPIASFDLNIGSTYNINTDI